MKDQVLSIERMQHLKELGVDASKGWIYWVRFRAYNWFLSLHIDESLEIVPSFTLQDILDLLPGHIESDCFDKYYLIIEQLSKDEEKDWNIRYSLSDYSSIKAQFASSSIIDAAYEMLCWCAENGYIKTNKDK